MTIRRVEIEPTDHESKTTRVGEVKIESDGTPFGTRAYVRGSDGGWVLMERVSSISFSIAAADQTGTATIVIAAPAVQLSCVAKIATEVHS